MSGIRNAFLSGRREGLARLGFDKAPHAQPIAEAPAEGTLTVSADTYGQFYLTVEANGSRFRCLTDTGASFVVFRRKDIAQLGLDPARLSFDQVAWTANGSTHNAAFRLRRLVIAECALIDVPAVIGGGELEHPLLGMSALQRMKMTVADGTMTLRW
jgi:clan AA aspartic protease (TIGR02281 family)